MGTAAAIVMGTGVALKAYGEYKEGQDTAKVEEYNASVATAEGKAAMQEAATQEQIRRGELRSLMSRQRLLMGSSGISGGTFEEVAADTAREGELEALSIRYGGLAAKQKAKAQAQLLKAQARSTRASGLLAALVTGATGGTQAYQSYKLDQAIGGDGG